MNFLLTGGAGYIGSHAALCLLDAGHNVHIIDNLSTGNLENIAHLKNNKKFLFIKHDILEPINSQITIEKIWHFKVFGILQIYLKIPSIHWRKNYVNMILN